MHCVCLYQTYVSTNFARYCAHIWSKTASAYNQSSLPWLIYAIRSWYIHQYASGRLSSYPKLFDSFNFHHKFNSLRLTAFSTCRSLRDANALEQLRICCIVKKNAHHRDLTHWLMWNKLICACVWEFTAFRRRVHQFFCNNNVVSPSWPVAGASGDSALSLRNVVSPYGVATLKIERQNISDKNYLTGILQFLLVWETRTIIIQVNWFWSFN